MTVKQKANADQVTKMNFFLIGEKEERFCQAISTIVCPGCQLEVTGKSKEFMQEKIRQA